MKAFLAAAITLSLLGATAAVAAPMPHRPPVHHKHKVCTIRHHHRVCFWR